MWRALGYLTALSVYLAMDERFVARVREINGEFATEQTEKFKPGQIKEYSTGLNVNDFGEFLTWFCGPSAAAVGQPKKVQAKLTELRHWRLAYLHVYCPDGRVHESKRMPTNFNPDRINFSLPQGTMRLWRSWYERYR